MSAGAVCVGCESYKSKLVPCKISTIIYTQVRKEGTYSYRKKTAPDLLSFTANETKLCRSKQSWILS